MSTLAVVIPLFNHSAFIAAALDSVYRQSHPADRVIVIDDGSTDDSCAIAERHARPGIEIHRQENQGAHAALNRGIELAADCEFVAILNSDDLWHPDRLARCQEILHSQRSCEVVCTGLHLIDPAGVSLAEDSPKARRNRQIWQLVFQENDPLGSFAVSNFAKTTSNLVARRKFMLDHPFGNYRYVHDYHFFLQAALRDRLAVIPSDLLGYRVHASNTIKADGRRAVVGETVQMHLDLLGEMSQEMAGSAEMRGRWRSYVRRLLGNYTDFRGELFLQIIAEAIARQPALFTVDSLPDLMEFTKKSEALPAI